MSTETNKAIVSRYFEEVWTNGRLDLIEEFLTEDVAEPGVPVEPGSDGRASLTAIISMVRGALPDLQMTLHDVIAEGNKVVTHWSYTATHQGELMGVPATGKQLTQSGAAIFRLTNARIDQISNFPDNLSLMQQLGVVPIPEAA